MKLPFPLLWFALFAMWLLLNDTMEAGQVMLAAGAALVAVLGLALLEPVATRVRRPRAVVRLAAVVLLDIARSNIAVAAIVLGRGRRDRVAGFVDIPLDLRHPTGLAALACIITSTPGTAWAGYDARSGVLTIHVLDLVHDAAWADTIKQRYERPLMEIFE
ncbi:MAG TPA: Na+/H+ antiporter subunit E [Casimicrobiaceae bacterium]|nr:Na+/H+ antiporter subunit E [Casimicrobiaceae bacterium]